MLLIGGIQWPVPTAIIGGVYLIGRFLYTYGYKIAGPKGRGWGFLVFGPIQLLLPIYTIVSLGYLAKAGSDVAIPFPDVQ